LFGTAVVSDIHKLHGAISELQLRDTDVAHSLSDHPVYVKKLDSIAKIDTESIANLSEALGDNMVLSHERFQQLAKEIMWLNITFFGQSTLHGLIRQLEFTLMKLDIQVYELRDAVQLAIQGTLSVKFINLLTLQSILRNVSSVTRRVSADSRF
jgi:hypothetical protein